MTIYLFFDTILCESKTMSENHWCSSCAPPSVHPTGPGPGQPAGRSLHQRPPAAQSRAAQDRGDGASRCAALCHFPPAKGLARLRLQDPLPLPGDRIHPAGSHRGQQAQGEEGEGGGGGGVVRPQWIYDKLDE